MAARAAGPLAGPTRSHPARRFPLVGPGLVGELVEQPQETTAVSRPGLRRRSPDRATVPSALPSGRACTRAAGCAHRQEPPSQALPTGLGVEDPAWEAVLREPSTGSRRVGWFVGHTGRFLLPGGFSGSLGSVQWL